MGLAPSEKHLEDWIVNNFNSFAEELDGEHYQFYDRIINRQLMLPHGISDLICTDGGSIGVVELKKGNLTCDVLGQCLRYIHDLKQIFYWVMNDVRELSNPDRESYLYTGYKCYEVSSQYPIYKELHGMIVGHNIEDKHLLTIANACDIRVVTYEFNANHYEFVLHDNLHTSIEQYESYIDQPLGIAMREVMQHFSMREKGVK